MLKTEPTDNYAIESVLLPSDNDLIAEQPDSELQMQDAIDDVLGTPLHLLHLACRGCGEITA